MAYEFIKFEVKDHVAYITLNNPQKKNPVPNPAKKELIRLFDICDFDDDIRLVVIRGAGGCFSAGGDPERHARQTRARRARDEIQLPPRQ